jgi:hypothetical protein
MHQCVAGAAAIHAMLWANNLPVAGNAFREDFRLSPTGSLFVFRKRANAGKDKEEKTRDYLMMLPENWADRGTVKEQAKVSKACKETWRVAISLLNKRKVNYVRPFDFNNAKQLYKSTKAVQAVCLWDVHRGFFHVQEDAKKDWEAQQRDLLGWYMGLGSKPPIVIRTYRVPSLSRGQHCARLGECTDVARSYAVSQVRSLGYRRDTAL